MSTELPEIMYFGVADYVVLHEEEFDLLGETDQNNGEIKIRAKQSATSKQNTLLHEALHAIIWESGANLLMKLSTKREEKMVRLLTPWILAFIRDNPKAIEYLRAGER